MLEATGGLGSSNNLGGLRVKGVFDNPNADINRQGLRLDSVAILDLRLEKQFQMPSRWGHLSLYFDAFNVLNENAVRSTVNTSGPAYGQVNTIVSPRLLRLGLGWFF